ncbi:PTS sugar transporter subunit IIA [Agathobaculum sp. Marseille-P7918]|uniref:PTS sugar transporter subunit IIA n=1 Tax=Agathobaculum sp. Marseille-P7918 TaxID=2479843 RepID=UPI003567E42E
METSYLSVINRQAVAVDVSAANKEEAFQYICDMLTKADVLNSAEEFKKDLYLREKEGRTGIGNGVAIPHGKSLAVKDTCISVVKLRDPIEWETLDGKPVRVLICFAVSDKDRTDKFLRMMAQVARKLAYQETIDNLMAATTPDELLAALA